MKHVRNYWSFVFSAIGTLLVGCVAPGPPPERASIEVQTNKAPVRNVTSFTPSLQCMDNLFIKHGKTHPIPVTSVGIQDATGKVLSNTRDMLISSLAKMSVRSHAIKYLDFDPVQGEVRTGRASDVAGMEELPTYNLRGAISGIDQGVVASSTSGGLNYTSPMAMPIMPLPGQPIPTVNPQYSASIGASQGGTSSLISVDMNVVLVRTREVLSGYTSTNQIVVSRESKSSDAGGSFLGFGVSFNLNVDHAQGAHQAVRTLIELGAIETMGKLLMVPYWQCLDIESTNPGAIGQARDWYETMSEEDRVSQTQVALNQGGFFSGVSSARMDDALREAIGKYQSANGLIASGRVDFDLYNHLLNANLIKEGSSRQRADSISIVAAVPIAMTLRSTRGPSGTHFKAGDPVAIQFSLNRQAYVYCYYQDHTRQVMRIFPNLNQPNPFINAGKTFQVPGENSAFSITMDKAGITERFACFATPTEIGTTMPENFKVADLTPLPGVDSINDLSSKLKSVGGADMVMEILNVPVSN